MKTGSLRLRLLVAGAASVVVALALSAFGMTLLFERHVERRVEAELQVHMAQLLSGLARGADGRLVASRPPGDPRFDQPLSGLYWQAQAGEATLRSRSLWDERLPLPDDELSDGAIHRHRIAGPGGAELIAVERLVALPASLGGGAVRVTTAQDTGDVAAAARAFGRDLAPYLALLAIFLIGAAYAQVAVGLGPLTAIRDRLAAVRGGRARQLGQDFPDEIRPLAAELDALLEAREQQIARARARAGDLAHGLKTPLQVLSGDVARLRSRGEGAIAEEIEQVALSMRRHVDRELARARMAAGNPDALAPVGEVVGRVVAVAARTPEGERLDWRTDLPQGLEARIDPDDLAEAIGNLVENAARHAVHAVEILARRSNGSVAVTVRDDGPGIPQDHRAVALARGGRLDSGGTGTGLGLAIVNDIAEAWGGRIEFESDSEGFAVIFSVAAHSG